MRKIATIILAFAVINIASAQGALDALRFSQLRYEGTARTMAMGNAFTSLGGDSYAMSINPASSAIYKYSEFTVTPSLNGTTFKTNYLDNTEKESWTRFGISNAGMVFSFNTGHNLSALKSINFGVAINKLNNYSSRSYSSGINSKSSWLASLADGLSGIYNGDLDITDNWNPFNQFRPNSSGGGATWREILAWNSNLLDPLPDSDYDYIGATENIVGSSIVFGGPINQEFYRERKGGISEVVLNMGANISDMFFFGANIGVQSLEYTDYQKYSESAQNPFDFDSKFSSFSHTFRQTSSGVGLNLKAGVIVVPIAGLRLGASISTPTWLFMQDTWDEGIDAHYSDGYTSNILSPIGEYNYRVNSPFRWNLGASYVFGKIALLSIDYEGTDYSSMSMLSDGGDKREFKNENNEIANNFQYAGIIRAGAEVRPTSGLALRAGYTSYGNPEKDYGNNTNYLSGGVGFSGSSGMFLDLAFQKRVSNSESFYLYNDYTNNKAPKGTLDMSGWKLLVTWGIRF